MVGNVAEAEDLTQEAFLQLHRKSRTFRGDSAFSTWLHRLSINVVLMHLRKKGLPLMSLDEAMEPSYDDGPGRSFGAPDLSLTGSIDRLALERAVAALPAGYRLIFVLHDVEGFEHNEIAAMLDCSVGNSKSQLHKARLKLRDALRLSLRKGGTAMTADSKSMSCEEFQCQLAELVGSGADVRIIRTSRNATLPSTLPGACRRSPKRPSSFFQINSPKIISGSGSNLPLKKTTDQRETE